MGFEADVGAAGVVDAPGNGGREGVADPLPC